MTYHPPASLGASGAALWEGIASGYELRPDEVRILEDACREADLISRLDAAAVGADLIVSGSMGQQVINPLISELRQHRATLANLLSKLDIPDESATAEARSTQARAAASARWSKRGA